MVAVSVPMFISLLDFGIGMRFSSFIMCFRCPMLTLSGPVELVLLFLLPLAIVCGECYCRCLWCVW